MSGLNKLTRLILRCANWLAGPERRDWIAAMAAETVAVGQRGTGWAWGCLYAVIQDRLVRDRWFLFALAALPSLAFCLLVPVSLLIAIGASKLSLPQLALVPIMLFGPLPFAWLLGRMRPSFSPVFVGTLGFLVYQAMPLLALWALTGDAQFNFWAPNVTYYNMPAPLGLLASWLVWVGATWWGCNTKTQGGIQRSRVAP